jgi:hypothetical protein
MLSSAPPPSASGIVAWHVRVNAQGAPSADESDDVPGHAVYAVGPDARRGAQPAWKPSDGTFRLHWADGSPLLATNWVEPSAPGSHGAVPRWSIAEVSPPVVGCRSAAPREKLPSFVSLRHRRLRVRSGREGRGCDPAA